MPDRPLSPWVMSTTSHWPALDRRRRVTQVHEVRAPADHRGVDPARLDAERVRDEGREVRVEPADRDAVDVGRLQPAVVERAPRGVGRERERRGVDGADLGGLGGADDRDPRRGHDALGRNTGSAVSPTGLEHDLDRQIEGQRVGIGIHLDQVREQARDPRRARPPRSRRAR